MNDFGFPWPESLNCERFPEPGGEVMCVGENTTSSNSGNHERNGGSGGRTHPRHGYDSPMIHDRGPFIPKNGREIGFKCPIQLKVPHGLDYSLKVGDRVEEDCAAPCEGFFFQENERHFARIWIGVWSILCAASCLFTVLTFLIDTDRFRYPERPIIFLSVCYLMVASAYVVGFAMGDQVSCQEPFQDTTVVSCNFMSTFHGHLLITKYLQANSIRVIYLASYCSTSGMPEGTAKLVTKHHFTERPKGTLSAIGKCIGNKVGRLKF